MEGHGGWSPSCRALRQCCWVAGTRADPSYIPISRELLSACFHCEPSLSCSPDTSQPAHKPISQPVPSPMVVSNAQSWGYPSAPSCPASWLGWWDRPWLLGSAVVESWGAPNPRELPPDCRQWGSFHQGKPTRLEKMMFFLKSPLKRGNKMFWIICGWLWWGMGTLPPSPGSQRTRVVSSLLAKNGTLGKKIIKRTISYSLCTKVKYHISKR